MHIIVLMQYNFPLQIHYLPRTPVAIVSSIKICSINVEFHNRFSSVKPILPLGLNPIDPSSVAKCRIEWHPNLTSLISFLEQSDCAHDANIDFDVARFGDKRIILPPRSVCHQSARFLSRLIGKLIFQ